MSTEKKSVRLITANLPPAMQREVVAQMIYDWLHEQQVTHRKSWDQISDERKKDYREIALRIVEELTNTEAAS